MTINPLYTEYMQFCNIQSDINEHMPLIYELACKCTNTTEFGIGYGRSTRAFIAALLKTNGSHISYDLKILEGVPELFDRAERANLDAIYLQENTLHIEIEPTDMLLVDSHHTYKQVKEELELHGDKVAKYILFHDIVLFGDEGQDMGSLGIRPAIDDWMNDHPEWTIIEERLNNNGMLLLGKV